MSRLLALCCAVLVLAPIAGRAGSPTDREICGDCADNDADGFTDFEDADCCDPSQVLPIGLHGARHATRARGTSLRVHATLIGAATAGADASKQDVIVQLRGPGAGQTFCTHLPTSVFRARRSRRLVAYRDRRGLFGGLRELSLRPRAGDLRLRLYGRELAFPFPRDTLLRLTIGFRDVLNAHRCATVEQTVR